MTILVTGGAGYIGGHTTVELLQAGYNVVVVDNFCNSHPEVLNRIQALTGKPPVFYEADVRDADALTHIFEQHEIKSVIHFAGLKAVGESTRLPLKYYQNNIAATLTLCEVMQQHNVFDLAIGHIKAIERIKQERGVLTYNLGTGKGYSVLEMVKAFELASGNKIACNIVGRRPGDIAECYADPAYAATDLGLKAERGLQEMMRDTWRWQSQNSNGYKE